MSARRFLYRALGPDGATTSDWVVAETRADALRRLTRDRKTVLDLKEVSGGGAGVPGANRAAISSDDRALVLKQLAVMTRAGVELLESLDIIATGLQGRLVADCLRNAALALRRGDSLAVALRGAAPLSYPPYVYALVGAGEASGRLALVLEEASRRLELDLRVERDIQNALVYPGFLVLSGIASVSFLFYVVVPRFADMLRNARADLSGFSGFVITTGVAFHDNALAIIIGVVSVVFALFSLARTPDGKRTLSTIAHGVPGLRTLLLTRQRAAWSRIMALALAAGVDVLAATALAAASLPEGKLKRDAQASIKALRSGRPVDEAYMKTNVLSVVDASLIRAGQRSGALGEMFRAVADRNDEQMRDALKRFTLIVEPLAIAIVASMIGAIVLGLVSALASIYDSIG